MYFGGLSFASTVSGVSMTGEPRFLRKIAFFAMLLAIIFFHCAPVRSEEENQEDKPIPPDKPFIRQRVQEARFGGELARKGFSLSSDLVDEVKKEIFSQE